MTVCDSPGSTGPFAHGASTLCYVDSVITTMLLSPSARLYILVSSCWPFESWKWSASLKIMCQSWASFWVKFQGINSCLLGVFSREDNKCNKPWLSWTCFVDQHKPSHLTWYHFFIQEKSLAEVTRYCDFLCRPEKALEVSYPQALQK